MWDMTLREEFRRAWQVSAYRLLILPQWPVHWGQSMYSISHRLAQVVATQDTRRQNQPLIIRCLSSTPHGLHSRRCPVTARKDLPTIVYLLATGGWWCGEAKQSTGAYNQSCGGDVTCFFNGCSEDRGARFVEKQLLQVLSWLSSFTSTDQII